MKTHILTFLIFLSSILSAQTIYEVIPGTKGNLINLTLVNASDEKPIDNIDISLTSKIPSLRFVDEGKTVKVLRPNEEKIVSFEFEVNRNAVVNTIDTINFNVSAINGVSSLKSFIVNYSAPKEFKLEQNFPNPFNPSTKIQYQLPEKNKVSLVIYDILGNKVTTLIDELQEAGYKEVLFNASSLASGIYIYRLISGKHIFTKKMILMK